MWDTPGRGLNAPAVFHAAEPTPVQFNRAQKPCLEGRPRLAAATPAQVFATCHAGDVRLRVAGPRGHSAAQTQGLTETPTTWDIQGRSWRSGLISLMPASGLQEQHPHARIDVHRARLRFQNRAWCPHGIRRQHDIGQEGLARLQRGLAHVGGGRRRARAQAAA